MLYHSFPHKREDNLPDKNNQNDNGIEVLESILKYGLLLVPSIIEYPGKTDDKGKKTGCDIRLLQCCFCLTAIENTERLKDHAKTYGEIHLEFAEESVYEIGALPVMYIPKSRETVEAKPTSLWHLASSFVHLISDFKTIAAVLEYLDEATTDFICVKKITVNSDTGKNKKIRVAQLRDILELILDGIVNIRGDKEQKRKEFDKIRGAIQSLCSLFNYTDDPQNKENGYLNSFRLHEWRIVPGMSVMGEDQDRDLTCEEQKAIKAVDSDFFGKELDLGIDDKNPKIIDLCRILPTVNGKPIQSYIRQIYVPDERYNKALAVAENNKFPADKIIPYDKEQGIPNNT